MRGLQVPICVTQYTRPTVKEGFLAELRGRLRAAKKRPSGLTRQIESCKICWTSPMLNLDLLRVFISVAENAGFTRAASELHRSQSAISMQIKRLEEVVGVPV